MAVQTTLVISQRELQEYCSLQDEIREREHRFGDLEENLKTLLIARVPIEPGRLYPRLDWRTLRPIAWKRELIEKVGPDYAALLYRNAKVNRICNVVVEEHAVAPLWKDLDEEENKE